MIKSMVSGIIDDLISGMVGDDSPLPPSFSYAPLAASYSSASFLPVTVLNTGIISFYVKGMTTSLGYLLGSDGSANSFYRGSDGRLRLYTDANVAMTFNGITELNDGEQHYLEFRLSPSTTEFWLDGTLRSSVSGTFGDITINCAGARSTTSGSSSVGSIFGLTLGNQSSWSMVSDGFTYNSSDSIGSNDITYNDSPLVPQESDFIEVD